MLTHEQLVEELMKRPGVKAQLERLEREEGALLDKQIQAHQADQEDMKPEYDLSKMKSRINPYSKEIDYTDEPIVEVKVIPDFLPPASELKFNETRT
jgi:hypothetical protein